eukprot:scaffold37563_cov59-Phaeocystis_antarctica.AAC.4
MRAISASTAATIIATTRAIRVYGALVRVRASRPKGHCRHRKGRRRGRSIRVPRGAAAARAAHQAGREIVVIMRHQRQRRIHRRRRRGRHRKVRCPLSRDSAGAHWAWLLESSVYAIRYNCAAHALGVKRAIVRVHALRCGWRCIA